MTKTKTPRNIQVTTKVTYNYSEQVGAILGHIYKEDNKRISLAKFNRYLKAIGLTGVKRKSLDTIIYNLNNQVTPDNSKETPSATIFEKVIQGKLDLQDVIGADFADEGAFNQYMERRVSTSVVNSYDNSKQQREFKRVLREGTQMESLISHLQMELATELTKPVATTKYTMTVTPTTAKGAYVILGSDWHIGARVKVMGNEFSYEVFLKRWHEFLEHSIKDAIQKGYKEINFFHLGDLIEGLTMRPTQGFSTEFTQAEQISKGLKMIVETLNTLAANFEKVTFIGIGGNHDRISGDKRSAIKSDNAMYLVNSTLLALPTLTPDNVTVVNNLDDIYTTHIKLANTEVALTHGERVKPKADKNLLNFSIDTPVDLLLYGHYHNFKVNQESYNRSTMMCGSIQGFNDYSIDLNMAHTGAEQTTLEILPDGNVVFMPYYFDKGGRVHG